MTFAIAFNYDTGDGRIDPVRVTRNTRWGGAPNDLDPNLVFSALYPGAMCEEFAFASPANPNGWQPRATTGRAYSTPPLVLASYVNASGERFHPGYYSTFISQGGTLVPVSWVFVSTCLANGNNNGTYDVGANITTSNIDGYYIRQGTLRLYVAGIG
jgi:hypothetical protein